MALVMDKQAVARRFAALIDAEAGSVAADWAKELSERASARGTAGEAAVRAQCEAAVRALQAGLAGGDPDATGPRWERLRDLLSEIARSRSTASDTASFLFALNDVLLRTLRRSGWDPGAVLDAYELVSRVLAALVVFTTDVHHKSREAVIARQAQDMLELSTPVVKLWSGILALPLIGTLDSARTQVVMESLLRGIVDSEATIAIIDITGVPTVDTQVAQHLLKTVAAARLMGAECVISGIRPQIAQTIVHLGVELHEVETRATLADAFRRALDRVGFRLTSAGATQAT